MSQCVTLCFDLMCSAGIASLNLLEVGIVADVVLQLWTSIIDIAVWEYRSACQD